MSALKRELTFLISQIPDDKLSALKPLLSMIYEDSVVIERVEFDDLDDDEKAADIAGMEEYRQGKTIAHDDIDWENL